MTSRCLSPVANVDTADGSILFEFGPEHFQVVKTSNHAVWLNIALFDRFCCLCLCEIIFQVVGLSRSVKIFF